MTDAQAALAQVRDALADRPSAGPWVATLRDLGTFQVATVDNFGVYSRHPDHGGNAAGFPEHDAAYIAKCNPENIAAILAHVEAQEAEIERLTLACRRAVIALAAATDQMPVFAADYAAVSDALKEQR